MSSTSEYEQQLFWLVIPDRTKVTKKEWNNYINKLLTKPIIEQMIINYYNGLHIQKTYNIL